MIDGNAWPCGACRQFLAEVRMSAPPPPPPPPPAHGPGPAAFSLTRPPAPSPPQTQFGLNTRVISVRGHGTPLVLQVKDLLPHAFTPMDLQQPRGAG